jgi:hypothetical protein
MKNPEIMTAYIRQSFLLQDTSRNIVDRKVVIERRLEECDRFAPEFNELALPLSYEERLQNGLPEPTETQDWFYVLELFYRNDE